MLYAITCLDKPDHGHVRAENRPAHLTHLESLGDRLIMAGPLIDEAADKPMGSLLIIDFADRTAAEGFAADDPYARAGLFAEVTIRRFRQIFPERPD